MEEVATLLSGILADKEKLIYAEKILSAYEQDAKFLVYLSQILKSSNNFKVAQFAGLVLKNFIRNSQQNQFTQEIWFNCIQCLLSTPNSLVRLSSQMAIVAIISKQQPATDLIQDLVERVIEFPMGIEVLTMIFQECDENIAFSVPCVLNELFAWTTQENMQSVLRLLHACLSSLAWADGVNQNLVQESLDHSFNNWLQLCISIIYGEHQEIEVQRLSMCALTVIFRDFVNYSKQYLPQIVAPLWSLLHTAIPNYITDFVYSLPSKQVEINYFIVEETVGIEGLLFQMTELLSSLMPRPVISEALKQELNGLTRTLTCFILLTKEQEAQWKNDPNCFIADEEEESMNKTVRSVIINLYNQIIELFGNQAIESILQTVEVILKHPQDFQLVSSSNEFRLPNKELEVIIKRYPEHHRKLHEVALFLLGSISEDLLSFVQKQNWELSYLVDILSEDLQSSQLIKGRALWTISKLNWLLDENQLEQVLLIIKDSLQTQEPLAIRLSAAKCLAKLARSVKLEALQPFAPKIFDSLLSLFTKISEDTLHIVLETVCIMSQKCPQSAQRAVQGGALTFLQLLKIHYSDSLLGQDLLDIFKIWCSNPACIPFVTAQFTPYFNQQLLIISNLPPEGYQSGGSQSTQSSRVTEQGSYFLVFLDILSYILRKSDLQYITPLLGESFTKLLDLLIKADDLGIILHATGCIRAFVHKASDFILQNPFLMSQVTCTIKKLLSPTINETAALHLGYLIVHYFEKLSPKIDTDILQQILNKILRSKVPSVVQGLVMIFARLINKHTKAMLDFLQDASVESRPGLKVLLDKWLIHQPLFRGKYTKNVTIGALTTLFRIRDVRIESLSVVGFNPSHSAVGSEVVAPLKILSTLIRCLDNESMPVRKNISPEENILQTVIEGSGINELYSAFNQGQNDRLDTVEDMSSEEEIQINTQESAENEKINVDLFVQEDEDFKIPENRQKGLGDIETGSEFYLSDMLDFEVDEAGDEADAEFYEDDLWDYQEQYVHFQLTTFLLNFLQDLSKTEYFRKCLKRMTKDDVSLMKKHIMF